jgi:hypothetical protein
MASVSAYSSVRRLHKDLANFFSRRSHRPKITLAKRAADKVERVHDACSNASEVG